MSLSEPWAMLIELHFLPPVIKQLVSIGIVEEERTLLEVVVGETDCTDVHNLAENFIFSHPPEMNTFLK